MKGRAVTADGKPIRKGGMVWSYEMLSGRRARYAAGVVDRKCMREGKWWVETCQFDLPCSMVFSSYEAAEHDYKATENKP